MNDDPISEAIRQIPRNELKVEGGATDKGGARLGGSLEREVGNKSGGVEASIDQKAGWSVAGFFKWVWR